MKWTDGNYYLFFSGNDYATSAYATGIANCGPTPLPVTNCKPLASNTRPYFGHSSTNPVRQLPEDKTGPGGMSIYATNNTATKVRASWHYLVGGERRSVSGYSLTWSGTAFEIKDCLQDCPVTSTTAASKQ